MSIIRIIKLIAKHPIASIKDFRTFGSVDAIEAINRQTTKYLGGFNDPNVKYKGPLFRAHVEETIKEWKKLGYDDEHIKYNLDTLMTDAKMTYGMKYQYEQLKKIKNPIIRKEVEQLLKESSEAYGNEYRSLYDNISNFDKEIDRLSKMSPEEFKDWQKDAKSVAEKVVENLEEKGFLKTATKVATAAVVATRAPERKVKTAISQYKPLIKGLKKSLTDQLNKRPWSEARNELIYKIEMMDELNLSQLYHENKELFAIYYYGDSPEYVEEYDSDKFVYGYNDVVVEYEKRFGIIL